MANKKDQDKETERARKLREAKERQKAIMAQFAAKQKSFMDKVQTEAQNEKSEEESIEKQADTKEQAEVCVLCREGDSADNPLELIAFVQRSNRLCLAKRQLAERWQKTFANKFSRKEEQAKDNEKLIKKDKGEERECHTDQEGKRLDEWGGEDMEIEGIELDRQDRTGNQVIESKLPEEQTEETNRKDENEPEEKEEEEEEESEEEESYYEEEEGDDLMLEDFDYFMQEAPLVYDTGEGYFNEEEEEEEEEDEEEDEEGDGDGGDGEHVEEEQVHGAVMQLFTNISR